MIRTQESKQYMKHSKYHALKFIVIVLLFSAIMSCTVHEAPHPSTTDITINAKSVHIQWPEGQFLIPLDNAILTEDLISNPWRQGHIVTDSNTQEILYWSVVLDRCHVRGIFAPLPDSFILPKSRGICIVGENARLEQIVVLNPDWLIFHNTPTEDDLFFIMGYFTGRILVLDEKNPSYHWTSDGNSFTFL